MYRKIRLACVLVAALLPVAAQTTSGSISGAIVDATRSAVPNAAVTATEQDKKFTLNAKADEAGRFVFGTDLEMERLHSQGDRDLL